MLESLKNMPDSCLLQLDLGMMTNCASIAQEAAPFHHLTLVIGFPVLLSPLSFFTLMEPPRSAKVNVEYFELINVQ